MNDTKTKAAALSICARFSGYCGDALEALYFAHPGNPCLDVVSPLIRPASREDRIIGVSDRRLPEKPPGSCFFKVGTFQFKVVHGKVSTLEMNLRKKSLPLYAYILMGALSDIRPVKLHKEHAGYSDNAIALIEQDSQLASIRSPHATYFAQTGSIITPRHYDGCEKALSTATASGDDPGPQDGYEPPLFAAYISMGPTLFASPIGCWHDCNAALPPACSAWPCSPCRCWDSLVAQKVYLRKDCKDKPTSRPIVVSQLLIHEIPAQCSCKLNYFLWSVLGARKYIIILFAGSSSNLCQREEGKCEGFGGGGELLRANSTWRASKPSPRAAKCLATDSPPREGVEVGSVIKARRSPSRMALSRLFSPREQGGGGLGWPLMDFRNEGRPETVIARESILDFGERLFEILLCEKIAKELAARTAIFAELWTQGIYAPMRPVSTPELSIVVENYAQNHDTAMWSKLVGRFVSRMFHIAGQITEESQHVSLIRTGSWALCHEKSNTLGSMMCSTYFFTFTNTRITASDDDVCVLWILRPVSGNVYCSKEDTWLLNVGTAVVFVRHFRVGYLQATHAPSRYNDFCSSDDCHKLQRNVPFSQDAVVRQPTILYYCRHLYWLTSSTPAQTKLPMRRVETPAGLAVEGIGCFRAINRKNGSPGGEGVGGRSTVYDFPALVSHNGQVCRKQNFRLCPKLKAYATSKTMVRHLRKTVRGRQTTSILILTLNMLVESTVNLPQWPVSELLIRYRPPVMNIKKFTSVYLEEIDKIRMDNAVTTLAQRFPKSYEGLPIASFPQVYCDPGSIPGFSHVGIVLDDAVGRRVFSGNLPFPRPFIPAEFVDGLLYFKEFLRRNSLSTEKKAPVAYIRRYAAYHCSGAERRSLDLYTDVVFRRLELLTILVTRYGVEVFFVVLKMSRGQYRCNDWLFNISILFRALLVQAATLSFFREIVQVHYNARNAKQTLLNSRKLFSLVEPRAEVRGIRRGWSNGEILDRGRGRGGGLSPEETCRSMATTATFPTCETPGVPAGNRTRYALLETTSLTAKVPEHPTFSDVTPLGMVHFAPQGAQVAGCGGRQTNRVVFLQWTCGNDLNKEAAERENFGNQIFRLESNFKVVQTVRTKHRQMNVHVLDRLPFQTLHAFHHAVRQTTLTCCAECDRSAQSRMCEDSYAGRIQSSQDTFITRKKRERERERERESRMRRRRGTPVPRPSLCEEARKRVGDDKAALQDYLTPAE
ncbi:hypothetical protein PR048_018471 [Dryococelus australis]|uniref:Uncharacterized protein n=1 Tax=Dryococelus australis TaxID=614101 RepID=A0ABQ9HCE3_9NEOP|nr:hypothetical protein PR048_018471 [Dryococelus australis]